MVFCINCKHCKYTYHGGDYICRFEAIYTNPVSGACDFQLCHIRNSKLNCSDFEQKEAARFLIKRLFNSWMAKIRAVTQSKIE
jgi:hypothetical protein